MFHLTVCTDLHPLQADASPQHERREVHLQRGLERVRLPRGLLPPHPLLLPGAGLEQLDEQP
jgi:hypothetical protein